MMKPKILSRGTIISDKEKNIVKVVDIWIDDMHEEPVTWISYEHIAPCGKRDRLKHNLNDFVIRIKGMI